MASVELKHDLTGSIVTVDEDDADKYLADFSPVSSKKKEAANGGNSGANGRDKSSESASGTGRGNTGSKAS